MKFCSRITDVHLCGMMLIGILKVELNVNSLVEQRQVQASHY